MRGLHLGLLGLLVASPLIIFNVAAQNSADTSGGGSSSSSSSTATPTSVVSCPSGEPLTNCFVNPCALLDCLPNSVCVPNYCNGFPTPGVDACNAACIALTAAPATKPPAATTNDPAASTSVPGSSSATATAIPILTPGVCPLPAYPQQLPNAEAAAAAATNEPTASTITATAIAVATASASASASASPLRLYCGPGTPFPVCDDGCNQCACTVDADSGVPSLSACTERMCMTLATCTDIDGATQYTTGDVVPKMVQRADGTYGNDGRNICVCGPYGRLVCSSVPEPTVTPTVSCLVDPCQAPLRDGDCPHGCRANYVGGCNYECLPPPPSLPPVDPTATVACLVDPCAAPVHDGICQHGCRANYVGGCNYLCLPPTTATLPAAITTHAPGWCPINPCIAATSTNGACRHGCRTDWINPALATFPSGSVPPSVGSCQVECLPPPPSATEPTCAATCPELPGYNVGCAAVTCPMGQQCQLDPCNCATRCFPSSTTVSPTVNPTAPVLLCPNNQAPRECPMHPCAAYDCWGNFACVANFCDNFPNPGQGACTAKCVPRSNNPTPASSNVAFTSEICPLKVDGFPARGGGGGNGASEVVVTPTPSALAASLSGSLYCGSPNTAFPHCTDGCNGCRCDRNGYEYGVCTDMGCASLATCTDPIDGLQYATGSMVPQKRRSAAGLVEFDGTNVCICSEYGALICSKLPVVGAPTGAPTTSRPANCFVDPCQAPIRRGECPYGCRSIYGSSSSSTSTSSSSSSSSTSASSSSSSSSGGGAEGACTYQCLPAPPTAPSDPGQCTMCPALAGNSPCNNVLCPGGGQCQRDTCFCQLAVCRGGSTTAPTRLPTVAPVAYVSILIQMPFSAANTAEFRERLLRAILTSLDVDMSNNREVERIKIVVMTATGSNSVIITFSIAGGSHTTPTSSTPKPGGEVTSAPATPNPTTGAIASEMDAAQLSAALLAQVGDISSSLRLAVPEIVSAEKVDSPPQQADSGAGTSSSGLAEKYVITIIVVVGVLAVIAVGAIAGVYVSRACKRQRKTEAYDGVGSHAVADLTGVTTTGETNGATTTPTPTSTSDTTAKQFVRLD